MNLKDILGLALVGVGGYFIYEMFFGQPAPAIATQTTTAGSPAVAAPAAAKKERREKILPFLTVFFGIGGYLRIYEQIPTPKIYAGEGNSASARRGHAVFFPVRRYSGIYNPVDLTIIRGL